MNRSKILPVIFVILPIFINSCSTAGKLGRENKDFLTPDAEAEETFRVLLTSDNYVVSQMKYDDVIKRADDPGGDKYMCKELKKFDKIDVAREGVLSIWLYPDSGNIMKVRPQKPTYILEIDQIINEDIQRWTFEFPKKYIEPTKLDIKYRVVLRKRQSDDEIIKEVQEKMRETQ